MSGGGEASGSASPAGVLAFGADAGPEATLFFAAGINSEKDGLLGTIRPSSDAQG